MNATLPAIGEKIAATGTIVFVRDFDGEYGVSTLVKIAATDGVTYATFSSGEFGRNAEAGQVVSIKGTVKRHSEFRGEWQADLTRVKLVELIAAAPAASVHKPGYGSESVSADKAAWFIGKMEIHSDEIRRVSETAIRVVMGSFNGRAIRVYLETR